MAARHVDITFSTAPTKSQAQRFFSLILQNVTDFSGYTADPVIGSYLTGGGTVTVNAVGDNMTVAIVNEWNVGTANAVTVLQIGNLYYFVCNNSGTSTCNIACSLSPSAYWYQLASRVEIQANASMYTGAHSLIQVNGYTKFSLRLSESYFAIARNESSGTVGVAGHYDLWLAHLYVKHDNDLLFFNRCDAWRYAGISDKSEIQMTSGIALYSNDDVDPNKPVRDIIQTNLGPLVDRYVIATSAATLTTNAPSWHSETSGYGAYLPAVFKETPAGMDKKPVFQFKFYDLNSGKKYDVSGIHNVLMLAYAKYDDFSAVVTNNGTTYRAVGSFLFAS